MTHIPPSVDAPPSGHTVLIVDDDDAVARTMTRIVARLGHEAVTAPSGEDALVIVAEREIDVVISDMKMPGLDGIELLRELHARDLDLPVVFLTGNPSIDSAAHAVEHGAFRYLTKPVDPTVLGRAITDAAGARSLARSRDPLGARATLETSFRAALEGMWTAFQPIVSIETRCGIGHEALLRSREPTLPHPGAVIDAAERLGAIHVLGRRTRALTAAAIAHHDEPATYFVNVHPADLADPDLFDPAAPLSRHARRIVIEITERSTLEGVGDLPRRIAELRAMGFRIAVDDLGAGYAGLSYFASLRPDVVKIDMSLVRRVHTDAVKKEVVRSVAALSRSLGIEVVGEGVETQAERDTLVELGCTYLQGYWFARPAPPLPIATWDPP
jgi:EAL domain-containing protein (putative c-di-GMP-specific phosphodiesterase class I)